MRLIIETSDRIVNAAFDNCDIGYYNRYITVNIKDFPHSYAVIIVKPEMFDDQSVTEKEYDFFCRAFMDRIRKLYEDLHPQLRSFTINDRILKSVGFDCGLIMDDNGIFTKRDPFQEEENK